MATAKQEMSPSDAVVAYKLQPRGPLVRNGQVRLGVTPKAEGEATTLFLQLAVQAATEATAVAIYQYIKDQGDKISPAQKQFHEEIARALESYGRDPEFINRAIAATVKLRKKGLESQNRD